MRLPWRPSLPRPQGGDVWRANFFRCIGLGDERYLAWQPTGTAQPNFHVPEAFGGLSFFDLNRRTGERTGEYLRRSRKLCNPATYCANRSRVGVTHLKRSSLRSCSLFRFVFSRLFNNGSAHFHLDHTSGNSTSRLVCDSLLRGDVRRARCWAQSMRSHRR